MQHLSENRRYLLYGSICRYRLGVGSAGTHEGPHATWNDSPLGRSGVFVCRDSHTEGDAGRFLQQRDDNGGFALSDQ